MNSRFMRNGLVTLVLVVGTAALLYLFLFNDQEPESIPYSGASVSVLSLVENGEVDSILTRGEALEITTTEIDEDTNQPVTYQSWIPAAITTDLQADIQAACAAGPDCESVEFRGEQADDGNAFFGLLLSLLFPVLLIGVFLWFMFRQAQGSNNQAMSFGRSRARMFVGNKTVVTFSDVAGVDEAKTELQEVVEFLKYPEKFNSLGARIPR
ncbi:MAG: cell division protein FtsH, partial [Candidatus Limnocylindrales bacterium]